jgi:VCBS repeat-containing protein
MQKLSGLFLFAVLISGAFSPSFAFAQIGPIAEDDFYSVNEDSLLTVDPIGVLLNDTNTQSDTFLAIIQTNVGFGTLTLNSDGSLTYQPNQDFDSTDFFTYVANNGTDNSNEATVTIFVNPINDAPSALGDFYTIDENTVLNIAAPGILGNDSDVDGDTLTPILDTTTSNGTLSLNFDGSFTYVSNSNNSDSFTYYVNDGSLDSSIVTVEITVIPENNAPVAQDDNAETQQNVPIRIDVLENDSDAEDDSLNILLTVDPSETKGTIELEGSEVLFTPIADFVGETTFSYVVSDGDKTSNSALVTVYVTAVDEPNDDSIFDLIFEEIQSLFDKVLNLEDEITQLKEENSALVMRITELESIVGNGIPTHDDEDHSDSDDGEISKKAIKNQIKALKKEFKAQEKELKKQLKDLKKDKKHHDGDNDDDKNDDHDEDD